MFYLSVGLVAALLGLAVAVARQWLGADVAFGVAILGLGSWLVYQLWHIRALSQWVKDFRGSPAPRGSGSWQILFGDIARLVRAYERQREQLGSAIASFRRATEAMPDGVLALDDHQQISYANARAQIHLGLQMPQDAGLSIRHLLRDPRFLEYLDRPAAEASPQGITLTDIPIAGRTLQIQRVPYGEAEELLLTRDISPMVRLETTRRDFVANVSHELKTPLTVIGGFIETLLEHDFEPAQQRQLLQTMGQQAARMQSLVEDLLVLSRLETDDKPLDESPIAVRDLLERLLNEARLLSRDSHEIGLAPNAECTGELLADVQELASALGNLVSNAVRYTPAGGAIELGWQWRDGPEGRQGIFWVKDTGPGIEPQHLDRITERFYRVDKGRSRDSGGTGLGLAIVKHIVERHGAHLGIESQVGQGSRFSVVFPAARSQPA